MAWSTPTTIAALVTNGSALANDTMSSAFTEIDNTSNLNKYITLEFEDMAFGTAPDDDKPTMDIYYTVKLDGTNSTTAPVTGGADQEHMLMCSVPILKDTNTNRYVMEFIPLPPYKVTLYMDNQTGQQLSANWDVNYRAYS